LIYSQAPAAIKRGRGPPSLQVGPTLAPIHDAFDPSGQAAPARTRFSVSSFRPRAMRRPSRREQMSYLPPGATRI
jgi:hypothetical protein